MEPELTIIHAGRPGRLEGRLGEVLSAALEGRKLSYERAEGSLQNRRILFAFSLPEGGVNCGLCGLLAWLRTHPGCLRGSVGGIVIDGAGDLYTKAAGRELVLAANLAGCAFPGRPLTEATGSLRNFTVQAKNAGCDLMGAYRLAVRDLADRVLNFTPPRRTRPRLLVLHASSRRTSNTLDLWSRCRERLGGACEIREIGLRNGTLEDCGGCPYTTCLHYGEQGGCFYGGVMVQEVYPAIREADAVVLLCPNYNDALSANLTAAVNRLTALYRTVSLEDKAVFAIVVSGYSGGDIVASQAVSALCLNKGFWLPPKACLLETANDAGAALRLPGVGERLERFSQGILDSLLASGGIAE
ncbi:NAD(P)H-dependent oxidoreductase [uncultured Oscillibacter sp.]|uniref:NAD(P)H-dependent oxidoreductase n=1 Tax=uncultured Oscillibacter sp. TaxID=876091 RepID=UPI0026163C32|nr:NAD(P)H-dependent oxidoreductase [uncultured Oscillibacter sp.]